MSNQLENAYTLGFHASGEGYNAEVFYDFETDKNWLKSREIALRVLQSYTEASTQEALLILDDAQANAATLSDVELLRAIDMAAQKLRPEPTPDHDAEALEQLAKKYPIDLPWMQPVVAAGTPSDGGRPNCLNSDCAGCKPGMIAVRSYEFEGGILHLELAAVRNMSNGEIVQMYGFGKGRLLDAREGQMPVKQFYALGEFLDM